VEFRVGDTVYPSKKAVRARCQRILATTPIGTKVNDDDFQFLCALISERHPDASKKIGPGISAIRVDYVVMKSPGLILDRIDGTRIVGCSYRKCLCLPTHRGEVTAALRFAVDDQIFTFLLKECPIGREVPCPETKRMTRAYEQNVDHSAPWKFAVLVQAFMLEHQLTFESIALDEQRDEDWAKTLADKVIWRSWQEFHRERAVLRIVDKSARH
jgi:hypothetical protein